MTTRSSQPRGGNTAVRHTVRQSEALSQAGADKAAALGVSLNYYVNYLVARDNGIPGYDIPSTKNEHARTPSSP